MNLYLDSISALERLKLSAMLPAEIEALTGSSPMQRVQIAGRIAAILEQLGQDAPAEIPPIELSGKEFGEYPDTPEGAVERRAAAWNHYLEQLIPSGGVFCQALQAKVQFNKTGAKKVISLSGDPRKVKLIAGLPEIIATGRKTSELEPTVKAAKSGVVKVFVLKANVNLEGEAIRARILVRQMADGTYGYDHSVDRGEAAQVTGGSSGALDSVVSTENGLSVLQPDEASPGRDLHHQIQMIGEEGGDCNVLDSAAGDVLNLFLDDEVVAEEPVRLKNFGWDAVKLSGYSFEQLEQLRHQVEAEHANPRDESGRYLENGQPSLYLYDKKGRAKLDKLGWAVTYKLQEAKREPAPTLTAKGNPLIDEAVLVDLGLIREVFGRWKYRYSVDSPQLFANSKEGAIERGSDAYAKADPSQLLTKEQRWEKSNADFYAEFDARYGKMSIEQVRAIMEAAKPDEASTLAAHARESNNNGSRRTGPAVATQGAREGAELARQLGRYLAERLEKESADAGPADQYAAKAVGFDTFSDYARSRIDKLPLETFQTARAMYRIVEHLEQNGRADRNTLGSLELQGANAQGPAALAQLRQSGVVLNNLNARSNPFSLAPGVTLASFVSGQAVPSIDPAPAVPDPAPTDPAPEPAPTPAHEIVEHVTKGGKGKTIRGIVRTDLSYAEAKAIDEYTFRKDGGYFIREKHLEGMTGIGDKLKNLAERRDPEDPEAEMRRLEAAAQAHADLVANEQLRQQQKITQQVTRLRDVAASTLERAEVEVGRDRLANTARRARMAASGIASAEADRALALTMNNLADAIERGQAKHLAGVSTRADVQTLTDTLRGARYAYERAKNISHSESERRKHDPITAEEAAYAAFPVAKWDSAGASRARILEMIKGKRGAPAIANEIRYASEMTRDQVQKLRAVLGQKELNSELGWWNVEQLARGERLRRAGIADTVQLRQALAEFVEFKAGARQEDPIAKAERAIIGQKVGIDFFPTPKGEANNMARLARIEEGDDVLEPSAGNGNLADAAKAAGANVDVIEISSQLRDILTAKGYTVVAHDFGSYTPTKQYDAILMNPPFSNRQDADHIMRAFTMLKPGGRLVAIAGEGVFFGRDMKATAFREWLDEHGAEVEALAGGTFKDTSLLATTGANARRIVITR